MPAPSFAADVAAPPPPSPLEAQLTAPTTISRAAHTRPRQRSRQSRQWSRQQESLQALQALLGVSLVAGAAWAAWKWWRGRSEARESNTAGQQAAHNGKKPGEKGYASPFTFNRKHKKSSTRSQEPASAVQAVPMCSVPTSTRSPAAPKPSGNPKKNKHVKQARKEAKRAKGREAQEADNIASVIAARAKAKGIADAGKAPDVGLVTTHSYEKTNDAFHHVQEWQESGKKTFR